MRSGAVPFVHRPACLQRLEGSVMFRTLRVLAAFFLVALMVFANPTTASAATSGILTFNMNGGNVPVLDTAVCKVGWAVNAGGVILGASSRCDGQPDHSPFLSQPYEGATGSFGFVLKSSSGASCGGVAMTPFDVAGNDVTSVAAGLGGGYVPITWASCQPVQACLSYYDAGNNVDTVTCVSISVDPPAPAPSASCPWGVAAKPNAGVLAEYDTGGDIPVPATSSWGLRRYFQPWTFDTTDTSGGTWWAYVITIPPSAGSPFSTPVGPHAGMTLRREQVGGINGDTNLLASMSDQYYRDNAGTVPPPRGTVIGTGYVRNPGWWSGYDFDQRVGRTIPGECSFYWGARISPSTDGTETPLGVLGPTVVADPIPDAVVEPPSDQPTDEPSLWGAILAILRSILSAISGLASAIVKGITGAFSSLFVPSDGYLESRFTSIENKWNNTSPAKYKNAATSFSVGSGSGCGGLPLNVDLGHGVQISESIGAACTGPMASAAGITRAVLAAVLVVSGLFACVRAVGSGLGWNPGVGRGAV